MMSWRYADFEKDSPELLTANVVDAWPFYDTRKVRE